MQKVYASGENYLEAVFLSYNRNNKFEVVREMKKSNVLVVDILPIMFLQIWENAPFIISNSEPSDSSHGLILNEAKDNFLQFGVCDRKPRNNEK